MPHGAQNTPEVLCVFPGCTLHHRVRRHIHTLSLLHCTVMNFEGFKTITFPQDEEIVYVLCFRRPGSSEEEPFYIGESGRGTRRLSDYITAQFAAPTDFKVGVVVKALQEAGAEVTVKFKLSADRKAEESRLIKEAQGAYPLLNTEASFNYKAASKEEQQTRFRSYAVALLSNTHTKPSPAGDA